MAREAAGTVFVQIDGDNSPLLAKFAQTEAIAKAAGTRIATGMGSGFQSATGIVGQFGVAVSSGVTEPLEEVVPAAEAAAASVRRVGVAAEGTVPEIAAASGAIRVFEGNMPIRAVERFATSILGLGPLLQAAFPLVGAIALIEMVSHVVGKFGELSEEEKKAADSAKQLNAEWDQLAVKFESGMVERATLEMGRLAGLKLAGFYEESTANRDRARLQAITEQAATARKQMAQDAAAASLSSNPLVAGAQALNPTVTISRYLANVDWKAQAAKVKPLEDEIGTLTEKLKIYDEVTKNVNLDQQKKQAAEDAKRIRNAAIAEVKSESELLKSAFDEELADARSNHLVSVGEEKSFWQNRLDVVGGVEAAGFSS